MTWLAENRHRLDRFRAGDPSTLAAVYRHYVGAVARALSLGFSFRSDDRVLRFQGLASPFEVDDVLQEVFARAFGERARLQYDGLRPYQPYLLTIARNLVIDRLRRAHREPERLPDEENGLADDVTAQALRPETPEEAAAREELDRIYQSFKAALSDPDRKLFELRFEQDATRARVSMETGLSAMQIRARESKLRETLYRCLVAGGYSSPAGAVLVLLFFASLGAGGAWD